MDDRGFNTFLAGVINAYWLNRGHDAEARCVAIPVPGAEDSHVYSIRSNLVNGLPAQR